MGFEDPGGQLARYIRAREALLEPNLARGRPNLARDGPEGRLEALVGANLAELPFCTPSASQERGTSWQNIM